MGEFADLAVLSDDYFSVPSEEIKNVTSVLIMVGGRIDSRCVNPTRDELRKVTDAHNAVAAFRDDGTTSGTPTSIWSAAVEDAHYIRLTGPTKRLMRWRRRA